MTSIIGMYTGSVAALAGGCGSAICKHAQAGPVAVTELGLGGDSQANRRLHGGPEQALHHFPLEHYTALAVRYPALAPVLVGGAIGENIATRGLTEDNVCIGDIYTLGSARVQVTRPRRPCGTIDRRFATDGMAAWIADNACSGWYYRVVTPGQAQVGDEMTLVERCAAAPTLALFNATLREGRPARVLIEQFMRLEPLGTEWLERLRKRLRWLSKHA